MYLLYYPIAFKSFRIPVKYFTFQFVHTIPWIWVWGLNFSLNYVYTLSSREIIREVDRVRAIIFT
jgi:hypothetical protein